MTDQATVEILTRRIEELRTELQALRTEIQELKDDRDQKDEAALKLLNSLCVILDRNLTRTPVACEVAREEIRSAILEIYPDERFLKKRHKEYFTNKLFELINNLQRAGEETSPQNIRSEIHQIFRDCNFIGHTDARIRQETRQTGYFEPTSDLRRRQNCQNTPGNRPSDSVNSSTENNSVRSNQNLPRYKRILQKIRHFFIKCIRKIRDLLNSCLPSSERYDYENMPLL